MSATIHYDDLSPEQRKLCNVPTVRTYKFTAEQVRSWALKVLAPIAGLSRQERDRVLKHAQKVNRL